MNKQDLMNFETDIFNNYSDGNIKAPVHLTGSVDGKQEEELIEIFKKVKKNDWVFSTHRSHYHALLKSKNPEWLRSEIFAKRSSHINSKKYKIFTSAIVGGICPIALGVAFAIKKKKGKEKVFCFVGDMASEMGIYKECNKYAINYNLPITFIIEDNGWGVYTPTNIVWGCKPYLNKHIGGMAKQLKTYYYNYKRKYPHYGVGKWIIF